MGREEKRKLKIKPHLSLTSYYLIFLQTLKLNLIPYTGVSNWIIDAFHHTPYTYWIGQWLQSPYSFFWQLWYYPVSIVGWLPFMWFMWSFDTILLTVVYKFQSPMYTLCFALSSWFFFIINPADILILWIAVLGKESWPMSIFAVIVKLPTLAPSYVWHFVFSVSIGDQTNIIQNPLGIPRYIFLGVWIVHPYLPRAYKIIKRISAFFDMSLHDQMKQIFEDWGKYFEIITYVVSFLGWAIITLFLWFR